MQPTPRPPAPPKAASPANDAISPDADYDRRRTQFLESLYSFMEHSHQSIGRPPVLGYQELDLYKLYLLVTGKGGMDEVLLNPSLFLLLMVDLSAGDSIATVEVNLSGPGYCEYVNKRIVQYQVELQEVRAIELLVPLASSLTFETRYLYLYESAHFRPEKGAAITDDPISAQYSYSGTSRGKRSYLVVLRLLLMIRGVDDGIKQGFNPGDLVYVLGNNHVQLPSKVGIVR